VDNQKSTDVQFIKETPKLFAVGCHAPLHRYTYTQT